MKCMGKRGQKKTTLRYLKSGDWAGRPGGRRAVTLPPPLILAYRSAELPIYVLPSLQNQITSSISADFPPPLLSI
jgi:hypothetical protein